MKKLCPIHKDDRCFCDPRPGFFDDDKNPPLGLRYGHKEMRHIMYHAKDIDKSKVYTCPDCVKDNFEKYKETTVFSQEGYPVTIPYICSECGKEKRCFRFKYDTKNNRSK